MLKPRTRDDLLRGLSIETIDVNREFIERVLEKLSDESKADLIEALMKSVNGGRTHDAWVRHLRRDAVDDDGSLVRTVAERQPPDETDEQLIRRRAKELLAEINKDHPDLFSTQTQTRWALKNLQAALIEEKPVTVPHVEVTALAYGATEAALLEHVIHQLVENHRQRCGLVALFGFHVSAPATDIHQLARDVVSTWRHVGLYPEGFVGVEEHEAAIGDLDRYLSGPPDRYQIAVGVKPEPVAAPSFSKGWNPEGPTHCARCDYLHKQSALSDDPDYSGAPETHAGWCPIAQDIYAGYKQGEKAARGRS